MSFSPSFADGLQSCTLAQDEAGTNDPITCPDASRIGEVTLHTPLLPNPQRARCTWRRRRQPLRLALRPLPGSARHRRTRRPDQDPGQDRSRSDHGADHHRLRRNPAVPLRRPDPEVPLGSSRALGQPAQLRTQTIGVQVASWAQPDIPVDVSNTYQVSEAPTALPARRTPPAVPSTRR